MNFVNFGNIGRNLVQIQISKFEEKNRKLNEIFNKSVDNLDLPLGFFENRMKTCPIHQLTASLPSELVPAG
jgi:hypothetical protein